MDAMDDAESSASFFTPASLVSKSEFENEFLPYNDTDLASDEYSDAPYPDLTQIPAICTGFIIIYAGVFIISLFGNAAVCFTVISNRKMQTVVNCYIVNLALCDLMVGTFVLPVKLLELTAPAHWGALNDGLCTLMLYLQTVFVFASVLTLVATCIERYLAIVHPLESRVQQSRSRTAKILLIVWLLPCIGAGPFLYPSEAVENTLTSDYGTISRLTCFTNFSAAFRKAYYTFLFVFFYAIPLTFIAWTCIRITQCLLQTSTLHREGSLRRQELNRRKVAKMILIVVAAFAISWTPYFLITIITQYSSVNYMANHNYFFSMLLINLFAFLNSSINPFIYAIMSSRFRTGFISILRFIFCAHSTDGANNSINGSNPINSNQLIDGAQAPPNNHRFRGRSAIARYHRQMVLMVCRGPTQVSTDSLPPTESPNHRNDCTNHVTINPTHELDTFRFVGNDHDHDPNHELNRETNFEGKQVVARFPSNENDNETILEVVVNNNDQTTLTNHVIHNGDAKNPGDAKISDANERDANNAEDSGSLNKMSSDREIAKEPNGPRRDRVKIAAKYSDSVDSKEHSAKQGIHKKLDCCERPDAIDEARSQLEDNDERQDNGRCDRNRFGIYNNQAGMDANRLDASKVDANGLDASRVDARKDLDAGLGAIVLEIKRHQN